MHWGGILFAALVIVPAIPFALPHLRSPDSPLRSARSAVRSRCPSAWSSAWSIWPGSSATIGRPKAIGQEVPLGGPFLRSGAKVITDRLFRNSYLRGSNFLYHDLKLVFDTLRILRKYRRCQNTDFVLQRSIHNSTA